MKIERSWLDTDGFHMAFDDTTRKVFPDTREGLGEAETVVENCYYTLRSIIPFIDWYRQTIRSYYPQRFPHWSDTDLLERLSYAEDYES